MRRVLKLLLLIGIGLAFARPGGDGPPNRPGGSGTDGNRPGQTFGKFDATQGTESASEAVQAEAEQGRGGRPGDDNPPPGGQTPSTEPNYPDQWASPENLTEHYENHKNDPNADWESEAEYREAAIDLMSTDGGRREGVRIKTEGDTSYFFDPATGEFGRSGPRGIITYYVPHPDPEAHFNRQPGTEV